MSLQSKKFEPGDSPDLTPSQIAAIAALKLVVQPLTAYLLARYPYGPVVLALMIAMYTVASTSSGTT